MAQRSAFRLPEGVRLDLASGRLDLSYDGDVEIEDDLGRALGSIRAGGDLTISLAKVTGDLYCGGTLRIRGPVDAGSLHARWHCAITIPIR